MKVRLARIAGFCMGVREAMELALDVSAQDPGPIFTYGPLIHNPSALQLLREKGIEVLSEIPAQGEGTVIIRAHGVTPDEKKALEEAGFFVIDGTCPRVIKVQSLAGHYAQKGYTIVVVGDKGHPEVKGILGHAGGKGILLSDESDLEALSIEGPYIIVAQTTQDRERFEEWSKRILERFPNGRLFDTICDSTKKRQDEVRRLAREVDAIIVVGGKKSANTTRLAEIAAEEGKEVFFVETEAEIDEDSLKKFSVVGVTAGASTPNWVINGVLRRVEAIPGSDESFFHRALWRTLRFLHESNLWTGLSGAALCVGSSIIMDSPLGIAPLLAFFTVFAMHTLNRILDHRSGRFNDPLRTAFLLRYREIFLASSVVSICLSIFLAATLGWIKLLFLLLIVALGIVYTLTPLKDLAGSKTLFVAGAWATVSVLVPCENPFGDPLCWLIALFSFLLVVLRDILMEIIDIQGDRLVGRETLTILLGEERMLSLASRATLVLAILSFIAPLLIPGIEGDFWAYGVAFLYGLFLTKSFARERLGKNLRLEILVEAISMVFMTAAILFNISPS